MKTKITEETSKFMKYILSFIESNYSTDTLKNFGHDFNKGLYGKNIPNSISDIALTALTIMFKYKTDQKDWRIQSIKEWLAMPQITSPPAMIPHELKNSTWLIFNAINLINQYPDKIKKDAVEFAEWIENNDWIAFERSEGVDEWSHEKYKNDDGAYFAFFTTSQLYDLFKDPTRAERPITMRPAEKALNCKHERLSATRGQIYAFQICLDCGSEIE